MSFNNLVEPPQNLHLLLYDQKWLGEPERSARAANKWPARFVTNNFNQVQTISYDCFSISAYVYDLQKAF